MPSSNAPARRPTGTDRLLVEVTDAIAMVTFNNPGKRNALSRDMRDALPGLLGALQADPEVRVVVLTGAGGKAFVSGADISEFAEQRTEPEALAEYERGWDAIDRAWEELDKPVIAMIQGFCVGGGLLTALQADIRVASQESQFGVPAARLGLGYPFAGVTALREVIGPGRTAELLFSGRLVPASEALQMGLVNRVVLAADLHAEVHALARAIARNAPLTLAACKVAIREAGRPPDQRDMARIEAMTEACHRSDDYREGQRAFAEKRAPVFKGA